ncbi:MAG TPA: hypothetical protein VNF51_03010 [Candidatus Paceibacterota bacterium]|nr:hypothetical protein [Candidatus Paceibacterota bacterium]
MSNQEQSPDKPYRGKPFVSPDDTVKLNRENGNLISPKSIPGVDIDINQAQALQYQSWEQIQKEMDALASPEVHQPEAGKQAAVDKEIEIRTRPARLEPNPEGTADDSPRESVIQHVQRLWAEIRKLESAKREKDAGRIQEIRQRLATLEREAASPADYPHIHDELENEVVSLEKELVSLEKKLRGLELGGPPAKKKVSEKKVLGKVLEADEAYSAEIGTPLTSTMGAILEQNTWQESFKENHMDHTPEEWRGELREVVRELKELEGKFGISERGESLEVYLKNRSRALAEEEKTKGLEGRFPSWREVFNALNFIQKLGIGVGLGVAVAISAIPPTVSETRHTVESRTEVKRVDALPAARQPAAAVAPDVHNSAVKFPRDIKNFEATKGIAASEMPTVGVSSHGYEGMLKDLMKHLPDTKPANIPNGSDLARLYEAKANPGLLEKTMYELAKDHKFLVGGESVRIDPTAHMTIVDGQLHLTDAAHPEGVFDAASDMHILHPHTDAHFISAPQAPHAEASAPEAITVPPAPAEVDLTSAQLAHEHELAADTAVVPEPLPAPPAPEPLVWHDGTGGVLTDGSGNPVHAGNYEHPAPAVHAETSAIPAEHSLMHHEVPVPEAVAKVDITHTPELVSQPHVETPPAHAVEAVATQPPAPVIEHGFISNQFGLSIPVAEPHIYADVGAKHLFVYGGSPTEKMKIIAEYLTKNPDKIIFSPDNNDAYRIPWHIVEEKIVPGVPMRTSGFLGWFSSFMKPPDPEEFEKVIK